MGNAFDVAPIGIGHVDLRVSAAGGGVNQQMPAVGHEVGRGIHGSLLVVIRQFAAGGEGMYEDLRLP